MKKRLTALLLAASMLPAYAAANANDEKDYSDYREKALAGIGILTDEYAESYSPKAKVTYGEFLTAVAGFMTEQTPEDVIAFAKTNSLVRNDSNFKLTDSITYIEAVKILVRAGGWSELVPNGEADDTYQAEAYNRKLLKNVSYTPNAALTALDMIYMLYNAIDAPVAVFSPSANGAEIEMSNTETILSRYRDIYEYEGIVADNGQTSLTSVLPASENAIVIGEKSFTSNDEFVEDYLGLNVNVFYKEDDGEYIVKYMAEEDNKVIVADIDDVSVNADFTRLTYYDGEADKETTVKLDSALKVIYNGEAYFDYTEADFTGEDGYVKLIDNNEDGRYEVALITKYETLVTSYVTTFDSKLVNKYTYSGAISNISLDEDEEDICVNYYYNGERAEAPEIKEWTVLSVAESKNGGRVKNIFVSDTQITGTIDKLGDTYYSVDEEEYDMTNAYLAALTAGDNNVPNIAFGREYVFMLDYFGKIAAVKSNEVTTLQYAVMTKLIQDDSEEDIVSVRFMDTSGTWYTRQLRQKVKLYDDSTAGKSLKASKVYEAVTDDNGKVVPQIVQLKLNDDGEVTILKLAVKKNGYDSDYLTVKDAVTGCYRWTTKMFSSTSGPKLYIADNCVIFNFPADVSYNEEDYSVDTSFEVDDTHTVTPYNVDEFMTTDCVRRTASASGTTQSNLFVVNEVSRMLDADDNPKTVIIGQYGSYSGFSLMAKDNSIFDGVQKGDVLRVATDGNSRVMSFSKLFSAKDGKQPKMSVDYSGLAAGTVVKVDPATKRVLIDCGDLGTFALVANNERYTFSAYMNDAKQNRAYKVDFSDIQVGDFLVANVHFAVLKDVIIIRNY